MVKTVVYKVGGSLLDLPDLPARLQSLISSRSEDRPLLIIGGGPTADLVREWDRIHRLGQERAHWLALQSMKLNERLLGELLPRARIVASRDEAEKAWTSGDRPILCAHDFLKAEEDAITHATVCDRRLNTSRFPFCRSSKKSADADAALPHNWDVTSDSIAAWVCLRWPAEGLVLVKSVPLPPASQGSVATLDGCREISSSSTSSLGAAVKQWREETGLPTEAVDRYFNRLAPHLPRIEWVNLRAENPQPATSSHLAHSVRPASGGAKSAPP